MHFTLLLFLFVSLLPTAEPPDLHRPLRLDNGFYLPYPMDNLFRGWVGCAWRGRPHRGIDIGGVGPDGGIGTPIRAMTRAKVIHIGLPHDDPSRFGKPLVDVESTERSGKTLPTSAEIPGYGTVHFFTEDYGRHRTGGWISLRILEGRHQGHKLHYFHIAAVRPDLKVGDIVAGGEEIALMGGTGVLESSPHLHLGLESPKGRYLDLGPLLGIGSTRIACGAKPAQRDRVRLRYRKAARKLMNGLRKMDRSWHEPPVVAGCGEHTLALRLPDQAPRIAPFLLEIKRGQGPIKIHAEVEEKSRLQPRIKVKSSVGVLLYGGSGVIKGAAAFGNFKRLQLGRKGPAEISLQPRKDALLRVELDSWRRPPREGRRGVEVRVTIPCP